MRIFDSMQDAFKGFSLRMGQLLATYAMAIGAAVIISFGIGTGLQLFFSAFQADVTVKHRLIVIFYNPLALLVTAVMASELADLGVDSMESPPFAFFSSKLAVATGQTDPDSLACIQRGVMLALFLSFAVAFVSESIKNCRIGAPSFGWGTFFTLLVTLGLAVIQVVAKVYISFSDKKRAHLADTVVAELHNASRVHEIAEDLHLTEGDVAMQELNRPGSFDSRSTFRSQGLGGSSPSSPHRPLMQNYQAEQPQANYGPLSNKRVPLRRPGGKLANYDVLAPYPLMTKQQGLVVMAVGIAMLFLMMLITISGAPVDWHVMFAIFFSAIFTIALGLMNVLPLNGCFLFVVILYFVIGFSLVSAMTVAQEPVRKPSTKKTINPPNAGAFEWHQPTIEQYSLAYPVCNMRWGGPGSAAAEVEDLGILEISEFPNCVYQTNEDDMLNQLNDAFAGTYLGQGITIEEAAPYEQVGRHVIFTVPAAKMRIIALRGTTTVVDVMADADLWSAVYIMQLFNYILPVFKLLDEEVVMNLNGLFSVRGWLGKPSLWDPLEAASQRAVKRSMRDGYATLITGHSLGGGIAQIIGAHLQIPCVVFSPVGIRFSMRRFGIMDKRTVYQSAVVVRPDRDLVPRIDYQIGFLQNVLCRHDVPLQDCHSLQRTQCELYAVCGDPRSDHLDRVCGDALGFLDWQKTKNDVEAERRQWVQSHTPRLGEEL